MVTPAFGLSLLMTVAVTIAAVTATGAQGAGKVVTGLEAPSPVLGHPIKYDIYLPAYPLSAEARYPVVYLLHGYTGSEHEWFTSGQIAPLLDAAIAAGDMPAAIVVTPDGGNSWYVDNPDQDGYGDMATAFTTDLIVAIDNTYPTLQCKEGRVIGGFSMGGTGAVLLGLDHPELYSGVMSLSGRFGPLLAEDADKRTIAHLANYSGAFGRPLDPERYNAANALNHIKRANKANGRQRFYIHTGDTDEPDMIEGAARVFDALRTAYRTSRFRVIDGWHGFDTWDAGLMDGLPWLLENAPQQCP